MTSNASTSVLRVRHREVRVERFDADFGVQRLDPRLRRLELRLPDVGRAVDDLALQVAEVDDVEVDEPQRADAGRGEIQRRGRAQPAGADAQHARAPSAAAALLRRLRAAAGDGCSAGVRAGVSSQRIHAVFRSVHGLRGADLSPKLRAGVHIAHRCSRSSAPSQPRQSRGRLPPIDAHAISGAAWTAAGSDLNAARLEPCGGAAVRGRAPVAARRGTKERGGEARAAPAGARVAERFSFAAVSAELLAQNNTRFLDLAKEKLGEFQNSAQGLISTTRQQAIADLVQPLRESLTKVDAKLQDVDKRPRHLARRPRRTAAIADPRATGAAVRNRAPRAGAAIAEHPRPVGELQLRRVLEAAGMLEGSHFEIKETRTAKTAG